MSKENQINRASLFYRPKSSPEINSYFNTSALLNFNNVNLEGVFDFSSDEEMSDSGSIEEMPELTLPPSARPVQENVSNVPDEVRGDSDNDANDETNYFRPRR